jgi:putative addiction module killer protein
MVEIRQTATYSAWLSGLHDAKAVARIDTRNWPLSLGNPGDVKSVGSGVRELRVDYGPGYRVYFVERRRVIVILLCGGDKRTQSADIATAKKLAKDL